MPLNAPTRNEQIENTRADLRNELPEVNTAIKGNWARRFVESIASRVSDAIDVIAQLFQQVFPQTATDAELEKWAGYSGLSRNPAAAASGNVTFTGTPLSTVPAGTQITSEFGIIYETQSLLTIPASFGGGISGISKVSTTVTIETSSPHQAATGMTLTITGFSDPDFNGDFEIIVTGEQFFTYEVASPTSVAPAVTGSQGYSGDYVRGAVVATTAGIDTNLNSGDTLSLVAPVAGIDNTCYAAFGGLSGGADIETDEELRVRLLDVRSNPVANFNESAIREKVFEVPGTTRAWVQSTTPDVGQVTIYFVRDNDPSTIIPDAGEIAAVKTNILTIKPAHTSDDDVIVSAPSLKSFDFTFTSLSPNTLTMQDAIEKNLNAFFEDRAELGTNIGENAYKAAISNTQDLTTGEFVENFNLSLPVGDLTVNSNELATLGTVTF